MARLSGPGLGFIKRFEAFVPFIYDDLDPKKEWKGGPVKGTLTIGYGHTKAAAHKLEMTLGLRVTEAEASEVLRDDLAPVEVDVNDLVKVPLGRHQFDALVSFKFNTGRLAGTGLLNRINANELDRVPAEFLKWVKAKGVVLKGLQNRRRAEIELWNR